MDDDLLKLESELKRLRPAEPSLNLQRRIGADLPPPRRRVLFPRWTWLAFSGVAVLAFAVIATKPTSSLPASSTSEAAATFKPVAAENLLLESRDEGYVTLADGTPARRTREIYQDTITWRNPGTNASLTWSVPREEVRVVPVAFQ